MSSFIRGGKWREGYEVSDKMLDDFTKKYALEEQDWRKGYWDKRGSHTAAASPLDGGRDCAAPGVPASL